MIITKYQLECTTYKDIYDKIISYEATILITEINIKEQTIQQYSFIITDEIKSDSLFYFKDYYQEEFQLNEYIFWNMKTLSLKLQNNIISLNMDTTFETCMLIWKQLEVVCVLNELSSK